MEPITISVVTLVGLVASIAGLYVKLRTEGRKYAEERVETAVNEKAAALEKAAMQNHAVMELRVRELELKLENLDANTVKRESMAQVAASLEVLTSKIEGLEKLVETLIRAQNST
jgi:hypothetical protein